jgi:hypothetical protein
LRTLHILEEGSHMYVIPKAKEKHSSMSPESHTML